MNTEMNLHAKVINIALEFAPVANFKAPYLKEIALKKRIVKSDIEYDLVFEELKKYLFICGKSNDVIAMLDERIDSLWHEFILCTSEYRSFCKESIGKFIDHRPNTSFTPTVLGSAKAFFQIYEYYFGILPDVWRIKNPTLISLNNEDINLSRLAGDNCGGTDCGGNCDAAAIHYAS
jgi:hypothetical protein